METPDISHELNQAMDRLMLNLKDAYGITVEGGPRIDHTVNLVCPLPKVNQHFHGLFAPLKELEATARPGNVFSVGIKSDGWVYLDGSYDFVYPRLLEELERLRLQKDKRPLYTIKGEVVKFLQRYGFGGELGDFIDDDDYGRVATLRTEDKHWEAGVQMADVDDYEYSGPLLEKHIRVSIERSWPDNRKNFHINGSAAYVLYRLNQYFKEEGLKPIVPDSTTVTEPTEK